MMTLPRPQDLNAPILRLVQERKALAEGELHSLLAFEVSLLAGNTRPCEPIDVWRFSTMVNIARKRLLRYGLLRVDRANRLAITPRGKAFLSRGLTQVNARSRHAIDGAVLDALESAFHRSA
jgi:hypothetical protein